MHTHTQDILSRLAQRSSAIANPDFYHDCVRDLAAYYSARVVSISLYADASRSKMRTFLFQVDDEFRENVEYPLGGTPCQTVLDSRQQYIPENVTKLYPNDSFMIELGIQSFFGVPLGDSHSNGLGLISIMSDKPMRLSDGEQSVLRVFACRIAAELAWQQRPEQISRQDLEYEVAFLSKDLGVAYSEISGLYDVINHDLRVPLRSVCGFSEALLEEINGQYDSDQVKDYCQRIHKASMHMNQQIEELAQVRRVSNTEIIRTPVDLSHLVEEIVGNLRNSQRYGHDVKCVVDPEMQLEGDRYLLKELMSQLIDNAWKFTIDTENPLVRVYREYQGTQAVYVVEDNGVGFDMRYANKLFTLFHKLHHDIRYSGNGVGLTLAHRVVRRHGGNIWGESMLGTGSRFCFTLSSDSLYSPDS